MSLEKAIEENTAALREMIAATNNLIALRTDAIETVKNTAATAGKADKPASTGKKATATTTETVSTETAGNTETTSAGAGAAVDLSAITDYDKHVKDAGFSVDQLRDIAKAKVGEFNSGSDRPVQVQARKDKIKGLLRNKAICKEDLADPSKFSVNDVKDEKVGVFLKNVLVLISRGDVEEPKVEEPEDELV